MLGGSCFRSGALQRYVSIIKQVPTKQMVRYRKRTKPRLLRPILLPDLNPDHVRSHRDQRTR